MTVLIPEPGAQVKVKLVLELYSVRLLGAEGEIPLQANTYPVEYVFVL